MFLADGQDVRRYLLELCASITVKPVVLMGADPITSANPRKGNHITMETHLREKKRSPQMG